MTGVNMASKTSWTIAGNLAYAISQWLTIILISKFASSDALGVMTLAMAFSAPIILFYNMNLRSVVSTDVRHVYNYYEIIRIRILCMTAAFVTILTASIFFGYSKETALVVLIVGTTKIVESISDIHYGILQKFEMQRTIAISMIARSVINLMLVVTAAALGFRLVNLALLLLAGSLFAYILIDYPKINRTIIIVKSQFISDGRINPKGIELIKMGFPLAIIASLFSVHILLPRLILERIENVSIQGAFAAISFFQTAGGIIVASIIQVFLPGLARVYFSRDIVRYKRNVVELLTMVFVVGVLGLLFVIVAGKDLLKIVYNDDIASVHFVLVLIMVASIFVYLNNAIMFILISMRSTNSMMIILFILTGLSIITSTYLISIKGITGAGVATIINNIVGLIMYGVLLCRQVGAVEKQLCA